jgi:hypothetical protein
VPDLCDWENVRWTRSISAAAVPCTSKMDGYDVDQSMTWVSRIPILYITVFLVLSAAGRCNGVSRGPWVGGVTDSAAVVVAKLSFVNRAAVLEYSTSMEFTSPLDVKPDSARVGDLPEVVRYSLQQLQPATRYYYRVLNGPQRDKRKNTGTFMTFPPSGRPASFRFGFASCTNGGSTHPVFTIFITRTSRPIRGMRFAARMIRRWGH